MARSIALAALLYALPIAAKTDIEGCTSFTSTVTVRPEPGYGNTYERVVWYVSDTLEICEGVDCGGGRAPPKNVPGCPLYKGTETVTPSFLEHDPMAAETTAPKPKTSTASGSDETSTTESIAVETTAAVSASDETTTVKSSAVKTDAGEEADSTYTGPVITSNGKTYAAFSTTTSEVTPEVTGSNKVEAGEGSTDVYIYSEGYYKGPVITSNGKTYAALGTTTFEVTPEVTDSAAAGVVVKAAGAFAAAAGAVAMAL